MSPSTTAELLPTKDRTEAWEGLESIRVESQVLGSVPNRTRGMEDSQAVLDEFQGLKVQRNFRVPKMLVR